MLNLFVKLKPQCGLADCLRWRGLSLSVVRIRRMATDCMNEFQLLKIDGKAGVKEDELYSRRIHDVESWWKTPRFEGIKRPYSADDIVSKSGALEQSYPSSLMAKKLFKLLQERAAANEPLHTSASLSKDGKEPELWRD